MRNKILVLLVILAVLLAGCGSKSKYTLNCNITTQEYGFGIAGETGTVVSTSNNESTNYAYDAGKRTGVTVVINRDLLFKDSQHKYHIEGTINLNEVTNEITYDITATGDTFGNKPQTCKKP